MAEAYESVAEKLSELATLSCQRQKYGRVHRDGQG
jgi:hypothetical protein